MSDTLAILGGPAAVPSGMKVNWPIVTAEDKKAVNTVLDKGPLWAQGADDGLFAPFMQALEKEFAAFCTAKFALACNGGTAAIHMALAGVGVEAGDEVITSAFSFLASPGAILNAGAVPIFADVNPRTFTVDIADVERRITPRTKCLLPVHIHGITAEMNEINALAKKHHLRVVEDACQAPGATYHGKLAGSLGEAAGFSLNGTKNFAAGEGGIFVTSDQTIKDKANWVRMIGETMPDGDGMNDQTHMVAWNYRSQELTSAFAWSQLQRLAKVNAQSNANGLNLTKLIASVKGVAAPLIPAHCTSIFHKFRMRLDPAAIDFPLKGRAFRDVVLAALNAEGVDAVLWLKDPLPAHPMFQKRYGFGKGYPWKLADPNYTYRVEEYPNTMDIIDNSVVICSEDKPIYCQTPALMAKYAEAIAKVMDRKNLLAAAAKVTGKKL
jgi:dTDP-4-amino-4,6-dideoxygalactose transaminase